MSTVQCPICALRFRYQSELEQHARGDHCLAPPEIALPKQPARRQPAEPRSTRVLRLP